MPSDDIFVLHRIIRYISGVAASTFFTEVRVLGGENVPQSGPMIVTATHHNMMLDPVILSSQFPNQRILHYWSKASLYANPVMKYILLSSGNIPVDRKSNDRQKLFKGTFEALAQGHAVALFPEGTSYTEPRIMQVKDGAAWAALEYTKWAKENPGKVRTNQDIVVVPAAIVYTNKSKYRSSVIMEFGKPITMDPYKELFFSDAEGAPRAAAKRLTHAIEKGLVQATVNAPDWDTLYAARMARDILWEKDGSIDLSEFVVITQTLVDLFSTSYVTSNINSVRRTLLEYYSLLQSTNLTNSVLHALPLPRDLDPKIPATLPSRLLTLLIFIRDSTSSLVRLPFFFLPLLVHLPVYIMGRIGARLVEDEEETQAQNKVAFGLISMFMIYPASFFFLWALFWYSSIGALAAAVTVYLFAMYHNRMINVNYEHAKRFIAAWRILIGVWAPKKWDLSLTALSQYTTPSIPKENPWIDKNKNRPTTPTTSSPTSSSVTPTSSPKSSLPNLVPPTPKVGLPAQEEPPARSKRRPPTRRIMRHVLRARVEAVKALASFFDQLEKVNRGGERVKVRASPHLAKAYGGGLNEADVSPVSLDNKDGFELPADEPYGWRYATEVIGFLKSQGAKIPSLRHGRLPVDEDWALSTDAETE
ncbi:hypothetical protein K435DRAFT_723613 [Dendrothele bispora CBS 962.96]|uniref:Phospholipid/glycerol acyltransferase domain-containing protein n=1 Tax=Dendrothele bispora (strain CBS 962.96) TaxID=1314807 RepID=A0A4S8M0G3_DENBC|nr:hypothetical protein K435DRAFT_723613 [Dendrothele bispora CBS 962.96]